MKSNKEIALQIADQLIERAEKEDKEHRDEAIKNERYDQAVGESFNLFYLKLLREKITEI